MSIDQSMAWRWLVRNIGLLHLRADWQDAEECAAHCHRLLADEPLRLEIALRGHERARRNNNYNEPMLDAVVERAMRAFGERR